MQRRATPHDDRLLDALGEVDPQQFSGTVWRVTREGRSVLDGSRGSGRWNPAHLSVLYTAVERDAALAEIHFHLSRGQSVFPTRLHHRLFKLNVTTTKSLSLLDPELLKTLGVNSESYREILYDRTQEIADAATFMGFDSIVAPSARHPSRVLVILLENFPIENIEVVSDEVVDWPSWRKSMGIG